MPKVFLAVSLSCLALVLNARRPVRWRPLLVPAFFASWVVAELALQLLAGLVLGAGLLAWAGGLRGWAGWAAVACAAPVAGLLWSFVRDSLAAERRFDEALTPVTGPDPDALPVRLRHAALPFKLWSRSVERIRDIPYAAPGTRRFRLDIWRPRYPADTPHPCLLYIPGGAWIAGPTNKNFQGKPLLIEMASRGWVCFAINYPVAPRSKFPAHIVAVKRAIAWIKENASRWGGDPGFLLVTGNSAGGHLAALSALTARDPLLQPGFEEVDTSVHACVPIYGVYDFTPTTMDDLPPRARRHKKAMLRFVQLAVVGRRWRDAREVFEQASPLLRVHAGAPPFLVIHGDADTLALVEEARAFVSALRRVSRQPVVYVELPRTQHAFDQFVSVRSLACVRAIARFATWAFGRATGAPPEATRGRAARGPTPPG